MGKLIALVILLSITLGVVFWKLAPNFSQKPQGPITLTIWDVNDTDVLRNAIKSYESAHPNITINLNKQPQVNYRKRVQTKIFSQGDPDKPDILALHNTWLGMFLQGDYLAPAPDNVISVSDYSNTFYPVVTDSFVVDKNIYAVPLSVDGLALYYNVDLLNAAGVALPAYWSDLIAAATKMTVPDTSGNIQTAGVALGSTNNVDYWSDILGLLFSQQPGVSLTSPANSLGADVLTFYTSFITDPKRKTWDTTMESSTQAFIEGKLAFYFAPSSMVNQIKAANPNLNFKVAAVPQLPNHTPVAWASFWGYGVSSTSPHQKEAWDFLKYLTSSESEQSIWGDAIKSGAIGQPYSRVDLQQSLLSDPLAGAFVAQGPYYKSWYLTSNTQDAGLDDEMIDKYKSAVDAILQQNKPPIDALSDIAPDIQPIIDRYTKVIPPSPSQ